MGGRLAIVDDIILLVDAVAHASATMRTMASLAGLWTEKTRIEAP